MVWKRTWAWPGLRCGRGLDGWWAGSGRGGGQGQDGDMGVVWTGRWAWPGGRHGGGLEGCGHGQEEDVGVTRKEPWAGSGRGGRSLEGDVGVAWKGRRSWTGRRHGRDLDGERGGQCWAKDAPE